MKEKIKKIKKAIDNELIKQRKSENHSKTGKHS